MIDGWTETDKNIFPAYNMLLSFAGSFILFEPQTGCISELIEMDLFKKLPVESENPKYIKAASYLRKIDPEHPIDYDLIIKDHLELFGGKGRALAPPYGSVYLSKDHILNDQSAIEVKKIYKAYGWKSNMEGKIPDDHLGIELQFINLLLDKLPELEDDVCRKEISKDILRFLTDYINPWINEWNDRIQQNAISGFYKGIGYLTVSVLEDLFTTIRKYN